KIQELSKAGEWSRANSVAWDAFRLIPIVIADWYKKHDFEWGVRSIPPLDFILMNCILYQKDEFEKIKEILLKHKDLEIFLTELDYSKEQFLMFQKVIAYIEENPDTIQSKIGKAI